VTCGHERPAISPRGRARRTGWRPAGLVLCLLACAAVTGAQTPAPPAPSWEQVVDQYLTGDHPGARAGLLRTPATDLTRAADRAYDSWKLPAGTTTADPARLILVRRLQASALLPVDVLIGVTGRALPSSYEIALEDAAREAWRRLAAFDDERGGVHAISVRRFRAWWRLAMVQHLLASGRFLDIRREADAARPPDDDPAAGATLALLRGVAIETRARLADEPPGGTAGVTMRRLPPSSRMPPMMVAMDEAGQAYRRALELAPGDRETTLRLARVALERNRLDEAQRLLAPVLQGECRDAICGLAYLFAGEIHEARGEPERASAAYARASGVVSVRPAALMAMIQASLRRGNAGTAYDLTRQFATPAALAPAQPPDAWAQYISGRLVEADRVIARLAATVAQ
jgi:tetratricopeptide (TPR) repeat protein